MNFSSKYSYSNSIRISGVWKTDLLDVARKRFVVKTEEPICLRRPSPPPARRPAPAPAPAPAPPAAAPTGGGGSGLFGQMAATAGGVAIGSAVGHTIGHALTGGGGGGEQQQQAAPAPAPAPAAGAQPCEFELRNFLDCSQNSDLASCEAFNQALKDCRARYGQTLPFPSCPAKRQGNHFVRHVKRWRGSDAGVVIAWRSDSQLTFYFVTV